MGHDHHLFFYTYSYQDGFYRAYSVAVALRCGGVDGRRSIWGADGLGCKWDLLSVLVLAWSRLSAFLICGCLGLRCAPLLFLPLEVLQAAEPQ